MGVPSMKLAILAAVAAVLCGCASMHPATCSAVGSVIGTSVGLVASSQSKQKSVITYYPGPLDPPGTPPMTVERTGKRGIPKAEGAVYGAVGGAAVGYAICRNVSGH